MEQTKDDATLWFETQGQDIQDYEVPDPPEAVGLDPEDEADPSSDIPPDTDPDRPYGDLPTVTQTDVNNRLNLSAINRPTAGVIVGIMDVVLPVVLCLIIKGANREAARLEESERETLTDAWATYLGDKNVQASPGVVLLVSVLTIYGAKAFAMQQERERERERDAQAARIAELEARLQEAEQARQQAERAAHQHATHEKQK